MEIQSERELAALLFGVTVAADLDCQHENTNSEKIVLGDFESLSIWVHKDKPIRIDADQLLQYHAVKGVEVFAENTAKTIWGGWIAENAETKKNEKQVKKCKK